MLLTHDWPTGVADVSHFGPTGDERVRTLIEDGQPILSLHGHLHRPASAVIGATQVECLAIVGYHSGDPMAAVGIWDIDPRAYSEEDRMSRPDGLLSKVSRPGIVLA
ncbi:MAG: hypothetical protein LBT54_01705 [Bifidobacteriaceae bacterium]|nr:hypothetical protein [Bifidobacteriaceae bacterium]